MQFYKELFGPSKDNHFAFDESRIDDIPQVSQSENKFLTASFTEKEISLKRRFEMQFSQWNVIKLQVPMASRLNSINSFGALSRVI